MSRPATFLGDTRVCVCLGPGGAGKTTIAAALALEMAARGLKVAAITIDPARRLAEALGVERLGNQPARVSLECLRDAHRSPEWRSGGELWAMMLDVRRTLDELSELLLPDEQAREALVGNRIYRQLADAIAGTQELAAVAKLYELDRSGEYDLLVLDTPPSRSALDLLDAPDRLTRFLESRSLTALLRSAGLGMRALGGGSVAMLRLLRRVTGSELVEDAAAFLAVLGDVRGGFHERAIKVHRLLRDPATMFLLLTAAEPGPVQETIFLAHTLRSMNMRLGGVVLNRIHHDELASFDMQALEGSLRAQLGESLARRVAENLREYHAQAELDRASERRLERLLGACPVIQVPRLDEDVHDLEGLARLARFLFADERQHEGLMADVVA